MDFKVGDIVVMTDTRHDAYPRLKNLYGKIIDKHEATSVCTIVWYTTPTCAKETKAAVIITNFFSSRLALYSTLDLVEATRTLVERKCRKLWNESKWVQKNPDFAY